MPRPLSEEQRRRAIRMKEMLGYQVDELAAALKMPLRASAQENRAKGGQSRKPNLPSFSVYR